MSQNPRFSSASRRFEIEQSLPEKPTPIEPIIQKPAATPPPVIQQPVPTSTLPSLPDKEVIEDLTIHIGPQGHKRLVNRQGEETLIQPYIDKYFANYKANSTDTVWAEIQGKIYNFKTFYLKKYNLNLNSKIYHYDVRDILLIGQFYENLIDEKEKEEIIQGYVSLRNKKNRSQTVLLTYGLFLFASRKWKWATMTRKNVFKYNVLLFGGVYWWNCLLSFSDFEVRSILEHHQAFENVIKTYEKEHNILY